MGVWFGGVLGITTMKGIFAEARDGSMFGYNWICNALQRTESDQITRDEVNRMVSMRYKNAQVNAKGIVTYVTERGVANMMKFVAEENLAGVSVTSIDMDDFKGECEADNTTFDDFNKNDYPDVPQRIDNKFKFLRTVNEGLFKAVIKYTRDQMSGRASAFIQNSWFVTFVLVGMFVRFLSATSAM